MWTLIDSEVFRDGPHPQCDFDAWIKATEGRSPCWNEAMHLLGEAEASSLPMLGHFLWLLL
jgi:hypothetical protein